MSRTGPSRRTRRPGARAARRQLGLGSERGWREALRRLRDLLESEQPAPAPRRASPGGNRSRDRHPLIGLRALIDSAADDRHRRLVPPLLAALAARGASARRLRLRLLERLQGGGRGRAGGARRRPLQRRLLALPQPERHRGLGLPRRPAAAPPEAAYFGVFFEVQNESEEPQTAARLVHDRRRRPPALRVARERKPLRLPLGGEVEAQEQIPVLDSTPQQGPIEGSLVLFLLPASASENRPLTLEITGPDGPARSRSTSSGAAQSPAERICARLSARRLRRPPLRLRSAAPRPRAWPFRPGRRRRTRRP